MAPGARNDLDGVVERALGAAHELARVVAGSDAAADRLVTAVESVGRVVDAARVHAASRLSGASMTAEELGFSSAADAVATLAGISTASARARLAVGDGIREDRSISGAPVPPRRVFLAEAIDGGAVGIDAAALICRELDAIEPRVPAERLDCAEAVMVRRACGMAETGEMLPRASVVQLSIEVRQIASAADPDGARPREERAVRRRAFRVGTPDTDGLVPVTGRLMPEIGGMLAGLLEAQRRSPRFREASDAAAFDDLVGDSRTPDQRRHDAFSEVVIAAAQNEQAPRIDGAPVTVLVTVAATDLSERDGLDGDAIGTMSGTDVPVSRARIHEFIDAGGYRAVTLSAAGAIAGISSLQRCFTSAQRLAIAARDGHRCAAPGCTSGHQTLQAHHVIPVREGGPTVTGNGILLCYWHHQRVDDGPWQYRMSGGVPEVRGPGVPEWMRLRSSRASTAA